MAGGTQNGDLFPVFPRKMALRSHGNTPSGISNQLGITPSKGCCASRWNSEAGPNNFTERKLEIYFDSKRLGRLWLGQGDTASNGTSEVDLWVCGSGPTYQAQSCRSRLCQLPT